jgi:signal transduction histidine kinase
MRLLPPHRLAERLARAMCLGWLLLLLLGLRATALSTPIAFSHVEASFCSSDPKRGSLPQVIDGIDAGKAGWSVTPRTTQDHSAIFFLKEPVSAGRFRFALLFLSGTPNAHFSEFSLSATSDPNPSLHSEWEPITPWLAYSTGTQLEPGVGHHLVSRGDALNTEFIVESIVQLKPITALRLEVFASEFDAASDQSFVAKNDRHDFTLTEFRAESFDQSSSNIALGSPVRASHAIWSAFRPEFILDGLSSTYAHPRDPELGERFFFEIDLGRVVTLDHFTLRGRSDGHVPERLSKLKLDLFEEAPETNSTPTWQGTLRQDGSYPPVGSHDVLRAADGQGPFRGRFVRISSNSSVAYSPQISEFEAYETHAPQLRGVRADGVDVLLPEGSDAIPILPADTRWFALDIRAVGPRAPKKLPLRWRLVGHHPEWQTARADGIAEGACPRPGLYQLEAQYAHSDGHWDQAVLRRSLRVREPWWMNRLLQGGLACGGILLLGLVLRHFSRRRLEAELTELERLHALDAERARIARDMHDVVGARLTQLSVLHEIFAREHPPNEATAESLQRLTLTAREAVAALDEVVWTVNPRNDSLPNVADYLCHCASEYLLPLHIRCLQDVPTDWEPLPVQAQTRHELFLAFKEALQNVVKHAQATEVLLTLRLHHRLLEVRVEDNGRGLPPEIRGSQKDGLGNMSARLAKIGGICQVTQRPGGGTSVILQVPL